jgi:hypothetical protein
MSVMQLFPDAVSPAIAVIAAIVSIAAVAAITAIVSIAAVAAVITIVAAPAVAAGVGAGVPRE